MKHCINCSFYKREMVDFPNGQSGLASVCGHAECTDPIDASQIPCPVARREELFCGFKARYFKPKEEEDKDRSLLRLV